MLRIAARECLYLMTAMAVSYWATWLVGNPSASTAAMLVAFVIPAAICLLRASYLKWPPTDAGWFRRQSYQLVMSCALICLLVCDVAVGMLLNNPGVPIGVWAVIVFLGLLYLLLFCAARRIGFGPLHQQDDTIEAGE